MKLMLHAVETLVDADAGQEHRQGSAARSCQMTRGEVRRWV
jgi:hypothetical protein